MLQVVFMSALAVVDTPEDLVRQVDADLPGCWSVVCLTVCNGVLGLTSAYLKPGLSTPLVVALRPAVNGSFGVDIAKAAIREMVDKAAHETGCELTIQLRGM